MATQSSQDQFPAFFALTGIARAIAACGTLAIAACSSSDSNNIAAQTIAPAISCSALAAQLTLSNTRITSVELDSGGQVDSMFPNAGPKPESCVIKGTIGAYTSAYTNPDTGSNLYGTDFELRLPTRWNGRFFYQGGGGADGFVQEADGPIPGQQGGFSGSPQTPALWRGYAVVSSDGGHYSGNTQAAAMMSGFGVDPIARVNYGYASIGQVTPIAKQIIAQYYARKPVHSYFLGCSKGGQEAMQASQKYGDQFDGIVAGDPGFRLPHAALAEAWETQVLADVVRTDSPSSIDAQGHPLLFKAFSSTDLNILRQGVLGACDALDGLEDGLVFNSAACASKFDPATLQCSGSKNDSCLSAAQVIAVRKIFDGAKSASGNNLYASFPYDTDMDGFMGWTAWYLGFSSTENSAWNLTLGGTASAYIFTTPPDPALDMFTVTMDDFASRIIATAGAYSVASVDFMEATSTNLDALRKNGGKLIIFHGASDPVFSMNDTIDYYNQLSKSYGKNTADFARLFLVPGMNHCGGGAYTTDYFATLDALVDWVEHDKAPDTLSAQPGDPASSSLPAGTTRPLCAYPKYAHYKGSGDANNANSYTCENP